MAGNLFLVNSPTDWFREDPLVEALIDCQSRHFVGFVPARVTLTFRPDKGNLEPQQLPASLVCHRRGSISTSNYVRWEYVGEALDKLRRPILSIFFVTKRLLDHAEHLRMLLGELNTRNLLVVVASIDGSLYDPPPSATSVAEFLREQAVIDVAGRELKAQAESIQGRLIELFFDVSRRTTVADSASLESTAEAQAPPRVSWIRWTSTVWQLLTCPEVVVVLGPPREVRPPKAWQAPTGQMPVVPRGSISWATRLHNWAPLRAFRTAWSLAGGGLDWVKTTVFAPPVVARNKTFLVQVVFHLSEQMKEAEELAVALDSGAVKRGFRTLTKRIRRGWLLAVRLTMRDAAVAPAVDTGVWNGEAEPVTFSVRIPGDCPQSQLIGEVTVSVDDIPVGTIRFQLTVADGAPDRALGQLTPLPIGDSAHKFNLVFISYSSQDRPEVLKRVQMLQVLKINFFQDFLNINRFERWDDRIYREIDRCDLFLVFWSTPARDSEWVLKELRYAFERKAKDSLPQIHPVVIEGPPVPEPPEDLKEYHFNDFVIYLIAAAELEQARKSAQRSLSTA